MAYTSYVPSNESGKLPSMAVSFITFTAFLLASPAILTNFTQDIVQSLFELYGLGFSIFGIVAVRSGQLRLVILYFLLYVAAFVYKFIRISINVFAGMGKLQSIFFDNCQTFSTPPPSTDDCTAYSKAAAYNVLTSSVVLLIGMAVFITIIGLYIRRLRNPPPFVPIDISLLPVSSENLPMYKLKEDDLSFPPPLYTGDEPLAADANLSDIVVHSPPLESPPTNLSHLPQHHEPERPNTRLTLDPGV